MSTVAKDIAAILKKAGVAFQPLPKGWGSSSQEQIFLHLVPERVCAFDPHHRIVEATDYAHVLAAFAQATLDDFAPVNLRATGTVGGTVTVEFEHAGQAIRFKFAQDGHWVADAFHEQLRKFCRKHLPGNFLSVDTNISTDVYLPHKVIKQIEKKTRTFATTDALLDFVLTGPPLSDLLRAAQHLPMQVTGGYTRSGETLLTALVKSGVDDEAFMNASTAFGQYGTLPNRYGQSLFDLVRQSLGDEVAARFDGPGEETQSYADMREQWKTRLWCGCKPEYMRIIDALEPDLASMRFPRNLWELRLCHAPHFDPWADSAELAWREPDKRYVLTLQTLGPGGGALQQHIPADQADVAIDLLRRYCRRTLWTVPGQEGAWITCSAEE